MKTVKCNRCNQQGLVWKKSKNDKWYLAVEKNWQGDMGGVRTFYPAHRCNQVINSHSERNESFMFDLQPRSGA